MPELPEVETVCQGLKTSIVGRKFTEVMANRPNLRIAIPDDLAEKLEDNKVVDVHRRAKYIVITLADGLVMLAHLGMSGTMIVYQEPRDELKKHDHIVFRFDSGQEMVFNDPRRFGLVTLSSAKDIANHNLIKNLGVEPLDKGFDNAALHKLLQRKKKSNIKVALMDANLIVGIGNIYACEALFLSKIHPLSLAGDLSIKQCDVLVANIKKVLLDAIKSGGSTLRNYVSMSGETGYFQHKFSVYGKEGESCSVCDNTIERFKQSGRSTFFCAKCQKL